MKTFNKILRSVFAFSICNGVTLMVHAATPGAVVAWGTGETNTNVDPQFGQAIVPPGLSDVTIGIGGGVYHSVALKNDGTVAAWGDNTYGQVTGTATPNLTAIANPVAVTGLSGLTTIAAGGLHTLALKSDSSVLAWGAGKTNVANTANVGQSIIPAGLTAVTASAIVLANTTGLINTVNLAATNINIVAGMFVTGPAFTVGAGAKIVSKDATGLILTLSVPNANTVLTTAPLTFSTGVVAIAAGYYHSLALRSDGTVVGWGSNTSGQTTIPAELSPFSRPGTVPANPTGTANTMTVTAVTSALVFPGMAVTGPAGTVGAGAVVVSKDPTGLILTLSVPNAVNTVATSTTFTFTPAPVVAIAAGNDHTVALKSDGTVTAWGRNVEGQTTIPTGLTGVAAIAAGGDTSYALKTNGQVVAWGDNANGQATVPAGLSGVTAITAGGDHAVALKSDTTVVAWGKIWNGSVFVSETVPAGLRGVTAIAAGAYHTLAITVAPPIITVQPVGVTVVQGGTATLSVLAPNAVSYQWQKNGVNIPGATGATLTLSNAQVSDADTYTVVVTNGFGSVTSNPVTITGTFTPAIISDPLNVTVNQPAAGQPAVSASFDVMATGGSLSYQWQKNGVPIPGATNQVLTLANVTTEDVGSYTVVVINSIGSVTSKSAALDVVPIGRIFQPQITSNLDPVTLDRGVAMVPYLITANFNPNKGYSAKGLPKGLKLNSKTGLITGTPHKSAKSGRYLVTLQAKSKSTGGATASKAFTIP